MASRAIPEQVKAEGQDAGRVKMAEIMSLVNGVVTKKFGNGRWVAIQAYSEFYFRGGVYDRIAADPESAGRCDSHHRITTGRAQGVRRSNPGER